MTGKGAVATPKRHPEIYVSPSIPAMRGIVEAVRREVDNVAGSPLEAAAARQGIYAAVIKALGEAYWDLKRGLWGIDPICDGVLRELYAN
jgi:hypothetical protein